MSGSKLSDAFASPEGAYSTRALADEPLGLSVHSLPTPQQLSQQAEQQTRSGRLKMLALFLVCAAPVIASYFTYYVIRPEGRRNYGELIEPQRELPAQSALSLQGEPVPLPSLKGQWLLVSVSSGRCAAPCEQHLYLQRQLRESLGKDKDRLDWVWLIADEEPVPSALQPALSAATVLRVPPGVLQTWLVPARGHGLDEHLYVIDPMGHWMMRFPAGLDVSSAARAKRDLERLMRASASWDQAGR